MSNAKHGNVARWLRSLSRAWVVATLVLLVGFSVLAAATGKGRGWVSIAAALIAVAAYYTVALLLLCDEGRVKTGLALLVAGGLPASAPIYAAIMEGYEKDSFHWGAALAALFAVAQVGMITSAIAAYYAGNRAAGDRSLLVRCFALAVVIFGGLYFFVLPVFSPGFWGHNRIQPNSAGAFWALQRINTAEVTFASTYNKGFTDGLNRMGAPATGQPDENRADLLDPVLAGLAPGGTDRTVTRYGYKIVYTPGPGKFGTISTYTVVAQPTQYGVTDIRSYYTDETALIRATNENRAATANDPPI